MDLGALATKGGKAAKGKGKGSRAECLFCGRTSHYQWACPFWQQASKLVREVLAENPAADAEHALTKQTSTPEGQGLCFRCGKPGHMAARCSDPLAALMEEEERAAAFQMGDLQEDDARYLEELAAWEEPFASANPEQHQAWQGPPAGEEK